MISRRGFLLSGAGSVVAAVTAPSIIHGLITELTPTDNYVARYTYKTYSMAFSIPADELVEEVDYEAIGARYSQALASSMMQTRRVIEYNVLNGAFDGHNQVTFFEKDEED